MSDKELSKTTIDEVTHKSFHTWGSLLAYFMIIGGGLYSLTIIGAIFGVPVIFAGMNLLRSSRAAKEVLELTDSKKQLAKYQELVKEGAGFLKIQGIILIVSLVLTVIYIFFIFLLILVALIAGA
jgi:ABC-type glycerol-3-phosphate transport system permease component